MLKAKPKRGAI
uniref:Uncharacterized protein n=1 Tax=Rhizophora mucronata TaxID=61149 RepID=A0A2P2QGL9_RHIMU